MVTELLIAFGGGGALSGVIIAVLSGLFSRGKQKADAAKSLTDATSAFTHAVTELNVSLREEIRLLKNAIISLTDVVDEIVPHIGLDDIQRQRLKAANNAAKLAI